MKILSENGFVILNSIVKKMNDEGYVKLAAEGYMPLVAENVGNYIMDNIHYEQISLAHYGKSNGDLMADPEMIFLFNEELSLAIPFYYKNDFAYVEQYSILLDTGQYKPRTQESQASFAEIWMQNIKEQQGL